MSVMDTKVLKLTWITVISDLTQLIEHGTGKYANLCSDEYELDEFRNLMRPYLSDLKQLSLNKPFPKGLDNEWFKDLREYHSLYLQMRVIGNSPCGVRCFDGNEG